MNKKTTITFVVVAIIATGIGSVSLSMNLNDDTTSYLTKTNPIYFTNPDYTDAIHAQYLTVNPSEIRNIAYTVFSGTIIDIQTESVLLGSIDPEIVDAKGDVIEPRVDQTIFTVQVDKIGKGEGIGRTIEISTHIPSKIDFDIADKVIVMANNNKGNYELTSGPHGMYKILEDEAIGHEFTLPHKVLLE